MRRRELHDRAKSDSSRATGVTTGGARTKDEPGASMAILLLFARHRSLTADQIGKLVGLPTHAVYRHLQTLLQSGFVVESTTFGRYTAGPEVLRLAENYRSEALAQGEVRHRLEELAHSSGELAAYLVRSGGEALCVESVESPRHILRCSYSPGRSQPLLKGASARTLLANLSEDEVDAILKGFFLQPEAEAEVRAELRLIRERGYATSAGALAPGIWGASVPVFDAEGRLDGVVTTMAPLERASASPEEQERLIALTRQTAADLTAAHA